MSPEDNVKIVQQMYRAFLRRDVPGILVHLDDDIIWIVPGSSAVPMDVRKGLTEVRQFFETVKKMLEFRLFEPREYIAQGSRVVTLVRYEGWNKSTDREFAADSAMVWTVENGKAVAFQEYTDTEAFANTSVAAAS
jgi:ketosteroid isomerase-like protein